MCLTLVTPATSAVAQGLCDTALGTDTGGSVRVPASFCGLYGIRPTHGRLEPTGMLPQAPTSDTTGWFARDAETFARVSSALLGEAIPAALPTKLPNKLIVAVDAFGFADADVAEKRRNAAAGRDGGARADANHAAAAGRRSPAHWTR